MSDQEQHDDEISRLGEFGLIRHLTRDIQIINGSTCGGVGDDAAVLDYSGSRVVVTTDLAGRGSSFQSGLYPAEAFGL